MKKSILLLTLLTIFSIAGKNSSACNNAEKDIVPDHEERVRISGENYSTGNTILILTREQRDNVIEQAEQGDTDAQYALGYLYMYGNQVSRRDYKKSFDWYKKSAEQGDADAQHALGYIYRYGIADIKKSYTRAAKWFKKSAEQGNAEAQTNLGLLYMNGKGVRKNTKLAKEWFSKASDQWDEDAIHYLKHLYYLETGRYE